MPDQLMQIWDKAEAVDMSRYEQSDYAVLLRKFFRLIVKDGRTTTHTPELIGWCVPVAARAALPVAAPCQQGNAVPHEPCLQLGSANGQCDLLRAAATRSSSPFTVRVARARYVLKALTARAPAWRYAVVYKRLLNWSLPMALPARWLDRVFALALGFKRLPRAPAAKQD